MFMLNTLKKKQNKIVAENCRLGQERPNALAHKPRATKREVIIARSDRAVQSAPSEDQRHPRPRHDEACPIQGKATQIRLRA